MPNQMIEAQAKLLAEENRKAEPDIVGVYWFPDEVEVRLVELLPDVPKSSDGAVRPYHFRANPDDNLPAPSGVALIRPDEFGKLELPEDWGSWESAVRIIGADE